MDLVGASIWRYFGAQSRVRGRRKRRLQTHPSTQRCKGTGTVGPPIPNPPPRTPQPQSRGFWGQKKKKKPQKQKQAQRWERPQSPGRELPFPLLRPRTAGSRVRADVQPRESLRPARGAASGTRAAPGSGGARRRPPRVKCRRASEGWGLRGAATSARPPRPSAGLWARDSGRVGTGRGALRAPRGSRAPGDEDERN